MVISQGEVWWADLGDPSGSAPGYRRPVVVVSAHSGVTNELDRLAQAALEKSTGLATIRDRHLRIVTELNLGEDLIEDLLKELESLLTGISLVRFRTDGGLRLRYLNRVPHLAPGLIT